MRNILSFLVGVVLSAAVLWLIWPENADDEVQTESTNWSSWSDQAIADNLRESSLAEVKSFVEWEMDQDLPANFVIPAHIANARSSGDAVRQVNREYSVFSSSKGDDFLRAVQQDPIRYREYLWAHKAIRKRFRKD